MPVRHVLAIAFAIAVSLTAAAPSYLPGDGGEYLALALNFAHLDGPAIAPDRLPALMQELGREHPGLESFDPAPFMRAAGDGSLDFLHFWFYSLLATPFVWLTQLAGAPPTYAFAMLNTALLLLAMRVVYPRLGGAVTLLLFASPIIWWVNKAHTEPYAFALVAIAMTLLREKPWWSLVAAGAAAAQTPPMLVFLGLVGLAGLAEGRRWLFDRRWLIGATAGVAIAMVQPAYFYLRYGVPYLLVDTTQPGMPPLAELGAPLVDPNIGLLPNFPLLLVASLGAAWLVTRRRLRAWLAPDMILAVVAAAAFLAIVTRNTNPHHGGTPSISRYALWLIPLAIPLLRDARAAGGRVWHQSTWAMAVASALICVFAFHPAVPQNSREPTWLATWLWTKHPSWYNPLPQVFIETHTRGESPLVPVTTPGCEKILIGGRHTVGIWPMPCYPEPVPQWCRGIYCYANRTQYGYEFTRLPGRDQGPGVLNTDLIWPAAAEPHVRELYRRWDWTSLRVHGDDGGWLRQPSGARSITLAGEARALYILHYIKPGASLFFRPSMPLVGAFYDPLTGATVGDVVFNGTPGDRWDVAIPDGYEFLILALRRP